MLSYNLENNRTMVEDRHHLANARDRSHLTWIQEPTTAMLRRSVTTAVQEPASGNTATPQRRKGRRPTRAEKGTYTGNQGFLREGVTSLSWPNGVKLQMDLA